MKASQVAFIAARDLYTNMSNQFERRRTKCYRWRGATDSDLMLVRHTRISRTKLILNLKKKHYVALAQVVILFSVVLFCMAPGKNGKQNTPGWCPDEGSAGFSADCSCADFYHIRIFGNESGEGDPIYEVFGYIKGGNLQIHHPIQ